MAELVPMPLPGLVDRLQREIDALDAAFDLPLSKAFFGSPDHDFSVRLHGRRASSPLGPAAGPHSQMAQNIALAWLGGCRIVELKTVQVLDRLTIPRPCIDMRTVGYNVEWSQELRLEESALEYVKGAMLITMLGARLGDRLAPGFTDTLFDMSVGYDLAGIRSDPVRRFIDAMRDCRALVARLREELPQTCGHLRDLPFPDHVSRSLTLSTFHGCPPDEIERICEHLMREHHLDVIVKLNPTLLGPDEVDHLLHDVLGWEAVRVPRQAFAEDTTWDQACAFTERLKGLAATLGLSFGVKFSNTLIVEHDGDFLPASEARKYLSGPPLHVLAMRLVHRFRERFGPDLPVSFSAGIDRHNFADAVALGLCPVTVCSDLLQTGGYARLTTYYRNLVERMDSLGVRDIAGLVSASAGAAAEDARMANTRSYVQGLLGEARYGRDANSTPPRKVGTHLRLFDCLTCDKCIPVCPNDANFTLPIAPGRTPTWRFRREDGGWTLVERGVIELTRKHQIANLAEFCNECGNCDVFCPEDGGPYIEKPRFFASRAEFDVRTTHDGFHLEAGGDAVTVHARFAGMPHRLELAGGEARYVAGDIRVTFSLDDPEATLRGDAPEGTLLDLEPAIIMHMMQRAALDAAAVNHVPR